MRLGRVLSEARRMGILTVLISRLHGRLEELGVSNARKSDGEIRIWAYRVRCQGMHVFFPVFRNLDFYLFQYEMISALLLVSVCGHSPARWTGPTVRGVIPSCLDSHVRVVLAYRGFRCFGRSRSSCWYPSMSSQLLSGPP